eukprot:tig00021326_g20287.t1
MAFVSAPPAVRPSPRIVNDAVIGSVQRRGWTAAAARTRQAKRASAAPPALERTQFVGRRLAPAAAYESWRRRRIGADRPPPTASASPTEAAAGGADAGGAGEENKGAIPASLGRLSAIGALRCVRVDGVDIFIYGANHVDPGCAEEVREIIRTLEPDAVLLELCGWRVPVLLQASRGPVAERDRLVQSVGLGDVYRMFLRDGLKGLLRAYMAVQLSAGAKKFGADTGNEFVAAAAEAAGRGVPIILADRSCLVTDERMAEVAQQAAAPPLVLLCALVGVGWAVARFSLAYAAGAVLFFALLPSLAYAYPAASIALAASEERLDDLYARALAGERLPGLLNEIFYGVLTAERDAVLAWSARRHPRLPAPRRRALLVAGAAHVPGVTGAPPRAPPAPPRAPCALADPWPAAALAAPAPSEEEIASLVAWPAGRARYEREQAAAYVRRVDEEAYDLLRGLYPRPPEPAPTPAPHPRGPAQAPAPAPPPKRARRPPTPLPPLRLGRPIPVALELPALEKRAF